jgi:uncharacterized protein YbcI
MATEERIPPKATSPSARISTSLVQLFAKYAGRGPTLARTTIGRDHVLVLVRDSLTKHEQTLTNTGREDVVIEGRQGLQGAIKDEAIALVEEVIGRKVVAFLSANHIDPDIGAELFVLADHVDGNRQPLEESEAEG